MKAWKTGYDFQMAKEKQLKTIKEAFAGMETIHDTVKGLKNMLESKAYRWAHKKQRPLSFKSSIIVRFNRLAVEFKNICAYETPALSWSLGEGVTKEQNMSDGSPSCFIKSLRITQTFKKYLPQPKEADSR